MLQGALSVFSVSVYSGGALGLVGVLHTIRKDRGEARLGGPLLCSGVVLSLAVKNVVQSYVSAD